MEQSRYIHTQFKKPKHFLKKYSAFIRPSPSSTYNCSNNKGIKHITRLRLGLTHLRDHKFKHGFLDYFNLICSCGLDVETTCHYLLHCPNFTNERSILLKVVSTINDSSYLLVTLLLLSFSLMVTNP